MANANGSDHPNGEGHHLSSDVFGQVVDHRRIDVVATQVRHVESEVRRECVGERLLGESSGADEHFAQQATSLALHFEGLLQLSLGDQIAGDQLVTETEVLTLRC